jgi:hypothetical protein
MLAGVLVMVLMKTLIKAPAANALVGVLVDPLATTP